MNSEGNYRGIAAVALLGLLATVGIATPSSAKEQDEGIEVALSQAREAMGESEAAVPFSESHRVIDTPNTTVKVTAPHKGDDAVTLAADGNELSVSLPSLFRDESVHVTRGGTATVRDVSDSATATIEALEDGVRLSTVISNSAAPTEYEYEFGDGVYPVILEDGSALLMDEHGKDVVGAIDAPWAADADGATVPTHYVVENDSLVQVVEHHGAAYPVVADPSVSLGWKVYVRYNKNEVESMTSGWQGTVNDKLKYASIFCAALIGGGAPGAVAAAACATYIYESMNSIMNTFHYAASHNRCMELQYLYSGAVVGWNSYSC